MSWQPAAETRKVRRNKGWGGLKKKLPPKEQKEEISNGGGWLSERIIVIYRIYVLRFALLAISIAADRSSPLGFGNVTVI